MTFKGHEAGVTSSSFTLDGKYLISGSDDKTIKIWPLKWDLINASAEKLLEQSQRETGLMLDGFKLVPWNPEDGKVSDTSIPQ